MTVDHVWVGAVSDTSAWVRGRTPGAAGVKLHVSTNPDLSSPIISADAEVPTTDAMVSFRPTLLTPNTTYYYALEVDSVVDTTAVGQFRTFPTPGQPASFTWVGMSCAGDLGGGDTSHITDLVSNHPVFDRVGSLGPLFAAHLGDMNYRNLANSTSDIAQFRQAYNDVLTYDGTLGLAARQGILYRNVPLAYVYDNHDGCVDRTRLGRDSAALAYRERVPHYSLPAGTGPDPIYQSWQVGRVLFVMTDSRTERSPVTDPDGPGKTVLGTTQKAWFRSLLEATTAEALVWLQTQAWGLPEGAAGWFMYQTEQNELAAMFVELGWADRMCTVYGDIHALGIDSGANNPYGGFPRYQVASLDGDPTGARTWYDIGFQGGRDQFMSFTVTDVDNTITITGDAISAGATIFSHSFTVDTTPDEPAPEPPPVDQSTAIPAGSVTWYGCDLITGRIIAELPEVTGTISRVLGASTSSALALPIPLTGPGALGDVAFQATEPARTMIVAVVNSVPTWAGIVLQRAGGTDATLQLGCVSLEGYLDRRFAGSHTWTQQDEASVIAAGLAADANTEGIGLVVDAPPTGVLRDRTYVDGDDATVYARLRELMGVEGGPEWTIDVDWEDDETRNVVRKTLRIRSRIGTAAAAPDAVFQTNASSVFNSRGASEARYSFAEDYTDGKGANHVIATSSGEGEDRPTSAAATDVRTGWPRYERRFSPSTSITDTAVLDQHAASDLALRRAGAQTFQIETRWDTTPRLNLDWRLGDDVAWELVGHRHPAGIIGQGRVIGWELDIAASLVKPILWSADDEGAA